MAVRVKRFVIDVNCWVTLFINGEADWLLHYVIQNNLELYFDGALLDELNRVMHYDRIKKLLPLGTAFYLQFVRLIGTSIKSVDHAIESPDPTDNYLYNIALTAHAKLLVTGEKALIA